jgi:hypothetical protein
MLKAPNARFAWEIDQQKQMTRIAGRIAAATQEFEQAASKSSTNSADVPAKYDV